LGVGIRRRPRPSQGEQRKIDLFGRTERVGCYNTFAAYCGVDQIFSDLVVGPVLVSRDQETGDVIGLRAAGVRSIQFHAESVLTEHGPAILNGLLTGVLDSTAASS
jgi:2-amino-4-deoxychorismate synthase